MGETTGIPAMLLDEKNRAVVKHDDACSRRDECRRWYAAFYATYCAVRGYHAEFFEAVNRPDFVGCRDYDAVRAAGHDAAALLVALHVADRRVEYAYLECEATRWLACECSQSVLDWLMMQMGARVGTSPVSNPYRGP